MAFGYGYPYQAPAYQPSAPMPYQQQMGGMQQQYQAPQQTMQAMQNQMPQLQQMNQSQPNVICRPVASEEEAKAVPTDFSGATLVLTDFGGGKIYCKSLNYQDGSAIFKTYQLIPEKNSSLGNAASAADIEYAPLSEVASLRTELESLRLELEETKKSAGSAKRPTTKGATE